VSLFLMLMSRKSNKLFQGCHNNQSLRTIGIISLSTTPILPLKGRCGTVLELLHNDLHCIKLFCEVMI